MDALPPLLYNMRTMEAKKSPLTARGLTVGIIGLIIITASSMYVALRMGALPWPTVFVTVLSMAILGKAKGSTLEEINCTHTLMSAGAMVAGGLAFTLPGLWMTDPEASLPVISIVAISVTGAVLGTLFTIIFRRTFIEKENLPYPMGEAAYNTLIAGKEGKGAPVLFTSLGLSALFTFIRDGLGKIPAVLGLFGGSSLFPALSIWVSPMALGIGAIIGPVLALMWFGGCVLGYFIITPIGLSTGLFDSMAAADAFRSNLGIGLMIGTGLGVAVKAAISLIKRGKEKKEGNAIPRNIIIAIIAVCVFAVIILAITTEITILEGILLIVGVYLTAYLSGMLTGQTGINPMEVFGILVLLAAHVLMGGEVRHDVETLLLAEDAFEDGIGKTQRVRTIIVRHVHAVRGAQVARQFGQSVLTQVHDHQLGWLERQHGTDERGADGTGTANDQQALALDFFTKFPLVRLDIGSEQAVRTGSDILADEFVYVEHII